MDRKVERNIEKQKRQIMKRKEKLSHHKEHKIKAFYTKVKNSHNKWDEEKGIQFLTKNWMKGMEYDVENKCYFFSSKWRGYGWKWATHNPFLKKWVSHYGDNINNLLINGWTPKDFRRNEIRYCGELDIEFFPIEK